MNNVRLIAVNDWIDSVKGEDDFTPFRNIMNYWYAKDISQKMRSTLNLKSSKGYAVGQPPFGYMCDKVDKKHWTIDKEGAETVHHIFELRKQGKSVTEISKYLKNKK